MVRALVAGRGRADGLRAWASLCAVAIEGGGYGGGGGEGDGGNFCSTLRTSSSLSLFGRDRRERRRMNDA